MIVNNGFLPLLENTMEDGMTSIYLKPDELQAVASEGVPFADLVNHLFRKIFARDPMFIHRIVANPNHYKKVNVSLHWYDDGSAEFSFNLAKLLCLKPHNAKKDLMELHSFFSSMAQAMALFSQYRLSVEFMEPYMVLNHPEKDDAVLTHILEILNVYQETSRGLTTLSREIQASKERLPFAYPVIIGEERLFSTLKRPHQNFVTTHPDFN